MPSLLDSVRKLISDAIWDEVDVSEDTKMRVSNCIETECTSLEKARVFITKRRLVVVLPEDLANANQAEANLNLCVDDHRDNLALEAEGLIWSDITPEPTNRLFTKLEITQRIASNWAMN